MKISHEGGPKAICARHAPASRNIRLLSDSVGLQAEMESLDQQIARYERCLKQIDLVDVDIIKAGKAVFDSEVSLTLWLCEPAEALGGRVPMDVISSQEGRRQVVDALVAMAQAVYQRNYM
jgi:hypothetical protein